MPGDLYIAWQPMLIKTILGSCVSMVFFSRKRQVSAISHAQLPSRRYMGGACTGACPVPCTNDEGLNDHFRYVSCSTEHILAQFKARGIPARDIDVKLFGGANVLAQDSPNMTVGERNLAVAYQLIEKHGLRLVGQDTGGQTGRTLFLSSGTGEVWIYKNR